MDNHIRQHLVLVINTLNTISVSGKTNLSSLVGSISVLENVVAALDAEETQMCEPEACDGVLGQ